jgi:hypothetical protein
VRRGPLVWQLRLARLVRLARRVRLMRMASPVEGGRASRAVPMPGSLAPTPGRPVSPRWPRREAARRCRPEAVRWLRRGAGLRLRREAVRRLRPEAGRGAPMRPVPLTVPRPRSRRGSRRGGRSGCSTPDRPPTCPGRRYQRRRAARSVPTMTTRTSAGTIHAPAVRAASSSAATATRGMREVSRSRRRCRASVPDGRAGLARSAGTSCARSAWRPPWSAVRTRL